MIRKFLFTSCCFFLMVGNVWSYHYTPSDFSNAPSLGIDIKQFSSTDADAVLNAMMSDTIYINFQAPAYGKKHIEFELVNPDTIWIKRAKKPQLNKHFYLCRAYNGKLMQYDILPDGSPYFQNQNIENVPFVLLGFLPEKDELGRTCIKLKELNTKRVIIWHVENRVTVTDVTLQNKVNHYLEQKPLFYKKRNTGDEEEQRIVQASFTNAVFEYDFAASEYSYPDKYKVKIEDNNSKVLVTIKDENKVAYFNLSSGVRNGAPYSFVTKDEAIKQSELIAQQNIQHGKDIQLDSTFFFPFRFENSVFDYITKEMVDIDGKTCFIYSAEKNFGSLYCYDMYCNGKKIKIDSFNGDLNEEDNSKVAFLQRRGNEGAAIRESIAIKKDKEQQEKALKQKQEFAKKQIFLTRVNLARGKYQCGVSLKIFNCYNKTIKYIDFTAASYNHFNDPQKDEIGVGQKSCQCLGPIAPTETGKFTFNELFWDKNCVISSVRLTNIKITFTDNTTVSFSGWNNIKVHYGESIF